MRARDIMSHPAITVLASAGISETANLLAARGFTAVPVTDDDGHLIGIVSEADLIRDRIKPDPRIHGLGPVPTHQRRRETVADVMSTSVESLTPGADVADIARMMIDEHIRCFPIVDGVGVVGVITRRDLLRAAVARSDHDLQRDVTAELTALDDSGRFRVTVQGGIADIEDYRDDAADRRLAERVAAEVPGVIAVEAHHLTPDPF